MSGASKIGFGLYIPQLAFSFDDIRKRVQMAEELGYDSVWFMDHLMAPGLPQIPSLEAWTLVSALATCTERIRLGHLVLCNVFRHPVVLAKMACTLDVISNGRLDLGIGTGSVPDEHRIFGLPFPGIGERTRRLEETIRIMKMLFTEEESTFQGEFYSLDKAPNLPKPVQQPHPPIHVGGGGEKFTLPLVARVADSWNCPTYSLAELESKIGVLREECRKIGRDPDSLRISEEAVLVIVPKRADLDEALEKANRRYPGASWRINEGGFVGTPEDVIEVIRQKAELGISHFAFFFYDRAAPATLELFGKEVIPAFA